LKSVLRVAQGHCKLQNSIDHTGARWRFIVTIWPYLVWHFRKKQANWSKIDDPGYRWSLTATVRIEYKISGTNVRITIYTGGN